MPITLSIEYESNVEVGENTEIEATVIDDDTGVEIPTNLIDYTWTLDSPIGELFTTASEPQKVVFSATSSGITPETAQNVGVTCSVSRLNRNPKLDTLDLNTLTDLGVSGIDSNMIITVNEDESQGAWFDQDDDTAFLIGSDRDLPTDNGNVRIGWVRYIESNGVFLMDRVQSGPGSTVDMSYYWGDPLRSNSAVNTKIPYLILGNGTIIQFETAWFSAAGNSFVRWVVDPTETAVLRLLETVTDYDFFLLGIATVDTLDGIMEDATQTVIVSIQGIVSTASAVFSRTFIRPILDKINVEFMNRLIGNTVFNKLESVDDKPRVAYGKVSFSVPPYIISRNQQRYRPVKTTVQFLSRIDGVSEFTDDDYVVMLQPIGDVVAGERGRSIPIFGVYDKTATSFSIAYEEPATLEAFGSRLQSFSVNMLWIARGK